MRPAPTKKAAIGELLRQSDGTTIDAMMKATGWLAHSVRATLTGLRKAGNEIVRSKDGQGASRYRVVAEPWKCRTSRKRSLSL